MIGRLFRNKSESAQRQTLFVFMRPPILRTRVDVAAVSDNHFQRLKAIDAQPVDKGSMLIKPLRRLPGEIEGLNGRNTLSTGRSAIRILRNPMPGLCEARTTLPAWQSGPFPVVHDGDANPPPLGHPVAARVDTGPRCSLSEGSRSGSALARPEPRGGRNGRAGCGWRCAPDGRGLA